jgi:hypothetical protein
MEVSKMDRTSAINEKIRDFVHIELAFALDDRVDAGDVDEIVKAVREFVELCLTGQGEFSIFQREEQAPKETPRPE